MVNQTMRTPEDVVKYEATTTPAEAAIPSTDAPNPDYISEHMPHVPTPVPTENNQPKTTKTNLLRYDRWKYQRMIFDQLLLTVGDR